MNCQEVTAILDDQRIDRLDPAQLRQVEVHVAACAECARAWHPQASLAALPYLALPENLAARCRAQVALGSQAIHGKRNGKRALLVGMLAALAAVAAVVALLLRPVPPPVLSHGTAQVTEKRVLPQADKALPAERVAESVPVVAVQTPPEPRFTVRVVLPGAEPVAPKDLTGREVPRAPSQAIADEAQRISGNDPSREQALQALHAEVMNELRKVPGLVLVESDPAEVKPSSRHYRLRAGLVTMLTPDGRVARGDGHYVQVGLGAEELLPGGKSINRNTTLSSIDVLANCSGAASVADTPCLDPKATAAAWVLKLRQDVFPPDSSVTRPLQAKLRNSSLDPAQRLKALAGLFNLQTRTSDNNLLRDTGMVRAVIELAANADPAQRAQIWRSMRGAGNPDLIEPLLTSLLQDPEEVRLAAAEVLAADFGTSALARSALEAAANEDPQPLVRAVAQRGLTGEEGWRQYVVASLKDSSRTAPERLEALVYYLYPPLVEGASAANPDYWQNMQAMLDDDALRALAEAMPDAGRLGGNANNLLGNVGARFSQQPVITEMLLHILDQGSRPVLREVAGQVLAQAHAGEPRVHDALVKALNSDPDPTVRNWIRQVMGSSAP